MVLERIQLQNRNWPIDAFVHWMQKGDLLLNPPYQRGVVWGRKRQQNFIRSIIQQIPFPSIVVNNRLGADMSGGGPAYAVIDGKQRLTAVLNFVHGKLAVPGEWFGDYEVTYRGAADVLTFGQLKPGAQSRFLGRPIAAAETCLKTIEQEQLVFEMINFCGLAQGEVDSDPVETFEVIR